MSESKQAEKTKLIPYEDAVREARKACRQFAMLYFHFAKTLYEESGPERAKEMIRKTIFRLSIERSDALREKAESLGLDTSDKKTFMQVSDLARIAWVKELGRLHCPYAETWLEYYSENPWFRELAPYYCDIIDTTNIENYSRCLSHRITKNVLTGAETCERVYYPCEEVRKGAFTYGE